MPRQMSKANQTEFAELQAFLCFFSTYVLGFPNNSPIHPSIVLQRIVSQHGNSKALVGLRQAINDAIEATQDCTAEWVQAFDQECRQRGVVTLSQLRTRYLAKYKTVLRRGYVRNDTEYYLMVGVLNDMAASIGGAERSRLSALASAYEKARQ